jgi:hypothetical protein
MRRKTSRQSNKRKRRKNLSQHKDAVNERLWQHLLSNVDEMLSCQRERAVWIACTMLKDFTPLDRRDFDAVLGRLSDRFGSERDNEMRRVRSIIDEAIDKLDTKKKNSQKKKDPQKRVNKMVRQIHSSLYHVLYVQGAEGEVMRRMQSALNGCTREDLPLVKDALDAVIREACLGPTEVGRLREIVYTASLGKKEAGALLDLLGLLAEIDVIPGRRLYEVLAEGIGPSDAFDIIEGYLNRYGAEATADVLRDRIDVISMPMGQVRRFF